MLQQIFLIVPLFWNVSLNEQSHLVNQVSVKQKIVYFAYRTFLKQVKLPQNIRNYLKASETTWKQITSKHQKLPESKLPQNIRNYLKANYLKTSGITSKHQNTWQYVELLQSNTKLSPKHQKLSENIRIYPKESEISSEHQKLSQSQSIRNYLKAS